MINAKKARPPQLNMALTIFVLRATCSFKQTLRGISVKMAHRL
jgi:hypothetical protein